MRTRNDRFFGELEKLIDKDMAHGFHKCADCGVADGCFYEKKSGRDRGKKSRSVAVVRLALINPDGPVNEARNVDYYCTRCRRGPKKISPTSKSVREKTIPMFDGVA